MSNFILRWLQERELTRTMQPLRRDLSSALALDGLYYGADEQQLQAYIGILRDEAKTLRADGRGTERLVPKAFALVRESIKRVLGLTPYDTQVLAGLALYRGHIVEMATGEGKTLAAPFAAFAHVVLAGRQVHVCTANEYLAQRDASMLLPLYRFLGLSLAVSLEEHPSEVTRGAHTHDVVYSTHRALAQGFLRDSLVRSPEGAVMPRQLGAVIVDEADAALIDEARSPVVLTGDVPADQAAYAAIHHIATQLVRAPNAEGEGDFWADGKDKVCLLTERGYDRAHQLLLAAGVLAPDAREYGDEHNALLLKLGSALAARHLLLEGQHYVVDNGAIVLIDGATGRLARGMRWDAGLHQALEVKEGLPVSPDAVPLARITLQHFFRGYEVLSGMTGTAMDDVEELQQVYGLPVIALPPNKPVQRVDEPERFYRTQAAKLDAVVADISAAHSKGQPVLIGTASVEQSAELSQRLRAAGLVHEVLNATNHAREAEIIASAGAPGAITVSTSMAGRGVDILLGGNLRLDIFRAMRSAGQEAWAALGGDGQAREIARLTAQQADRAAQVRAAGGLRVIGLERYESRRQDRQLRGRCGRQGDPGETVFYLSLEDGLVESFAGERIRAILAMLDVKPGDEFEYRLVKTAIDSAQREVEGRSQAARRQLMEYDGVLDAQRRVIYALRGELLHGEGLDELLERLIAQEASRVAKQHLREVDFPETWNYVGLRADLKKLGLDLAKTDEELADLGYGAVVQLMTVQMQVRRRLRLEQAGDQRDQAQRLIALDVIDRLWMHHLEDISQLRRGIHLRQHAKVDPRQAYAMEAFELFGDLTESMKRSMVHRALTWVPAEAQQAVEEPAGPSATA